VAETAEDRRGIGFGNRQPNATHRPSNDHHAAAVRPIIDAANFRPNQAAAAILRLALSHDQDRGVQQ
jgi:hypothetical protein